MRKNTAKAIQTRIDKGQTDFVIGDCRYECHYDHPTFKPFIICYFGGGLQYNVGNIVDGIFIPDAEPELR